MKIFERIQLIAVTVAISSAAMPAPAQTIKWSVSAEAVRSPAIGPDGTIYVQESAAIRAFSPDGHEIHAYSSIAGGTYGLCGPAVASSGMVFSTQFGTGVQAFSADLRLLWSVDGLTGAVGLAIGPDDTIYVLDSTGTVDAYDSEGSQIWEVPSDLGPVSSIGGIVVGLDGWIYAVAGTSLVRVITPEGVVWWEEDFGETIAGPLAVGSAGEVFVPGFPVDNNDPGHHFRMFVGSGPSFAFSRSGHIAVRDDQSIVIGERTILECFHIKFLPPSNFLWWFSSFTGPSAFSFLTTPVIGADRSVYAVDGGESDLFGSSCTFHALTPGGLEKYSITLAGNAPVSPAMAADGTVYVATWGSPAERALYAISTESAGPAQGAWPMRGHDARRSFCAAVPGDASPNRFLLGFALSSGALGTQWRTEIEAINLTDRHQGAELKFFGWSFADPRFQVSLDPHESTRLARELSYAGLPISLGAIGIVGGEGIAFSARTFNISAPAGTLGQYIPEASLESAIRPGETGFLAQLTEGQSATWGGTFRTNIGLFNFSPNSARVRIRYFLSTGTELGNEVVTLDSNEIRQLGSAFRRVTTNDVPDGYVRIEPLDEGAQILAYASVIDNASSDPIFIPARKIPASARSAATTATPTAGPGRGHPDKSRRSFPIHIDPLRPESGPR